MEIGRTVIYVCRGRGNEVPMEPSVEAKDASRALLRLGGLCYVEWRRTLKDALIRCR